MQSYVKIKIDEIGSDRIYFNTQRNWIYILDFCECLISYADGNNVLAEELSTLDGKEVILRFETEKTSSSYVNLVGLPRTGTVALRSEYFEQISRLPEGIIIP